jgi:threonine dehydrogenase-like Zn-dependent dehydrogenase
MQRYLKPLLKLIEDGVIDPSFLITHHVPLADAPDAYKMFRDKKDNCIKVVLQP